MLCEMPKSVSTCNKEVPEMMPSWYLKNPIGEYVGIYLAEVSEKVNIGENVSGGAITAFLCYLIDKNFVDGVIAARKTKGLEGEIIVAKSKEEIIKTAGSKWQVLPFTSKLKETIENEDLKKIAIVGLPCQIHFLRQMKTFPLLEMDFSHRIDFLISLFCYGTFAQESILNYIKEKYEVEISSIKEVKITPKALKFIGEKTVEIPFEEITGYLQIGCLLCPDYTGTSSDISAGIIRDKTIIISRNERADEMIKDAASMKYIKISEAGKEIIKRVEEESIRKINRASKHIADLL